MIKRVCFFLLALTLIFSAYMSAYSGDGAVKVTITGGIVDDEGALKEKESTFDVKRTIAGLAPNNTQITINVYTLKDDERVELDTYEITVGLSELFSQTVDLYLGENYIELIAVYGDEASETENFEYTCVITRKPSVIKAELQNSSILPWQAVLGKSTETK